MALLHRATLTPSKIDLLTAHLDRGPLTAIGAYRFDDPAGEVGLEAHIVQDTSGTLLHLPLTYRSEPLPGAEEWGVGTMDHSALGKRWVYNGCADPVFAGELLRAILTGGTQVEAYFEEHGERVVREPTVTVLGSGTPGTPAPAVEGLHAEAFDSGTLIDTGHGAVVVRHILDGPEPDDMRGSLSGTWDGLEQPIVLAYLP